jgi:hypothetical protein
MTPSVSAKTFVALIAVVAVFQLGLALGAPWGKITLGGAFPGALPPQLRLAACAQIALLVLSALIILSRVGDALPSWHGASRRLAWFIVGLFAVSVALNLVTPSGWERVIWTPIALGLVLTSLRVALGRYTGASTRLWRPFSANCGHSARSAIQTFAS